MNIRKEYRLDEQVSTYSWSTVERLKEHPLWYSDPAMRFHPTTPDKVAKRTTESKNKGGESVTVQKREYYDVRNDRLQNRHTDTKVTVKKQVLTPTGVYVSPKNQQTDPNRHTGATQYGGDPAAQTTAIHKALAEATGEKETRSLPEWWDWWYDFNEVYVPSLAPQNASNQPNVTTTNSTTPTGEVGKAAEAQRGDCLAVGTLVRTETGPVAIENIAVGDRIFCCDPETGCLVLKPVLRKTVRPEGRLLKIRAGGEEFEASGGQVFWVAGRGRIKARDFRDGMNLHTIHGTVPVEAVESGASQGTIGLATADLHTFYAGKAMVLTHDNTIRKPTNRIVPGLVANAATAPR